MRNIECAKISSVLHETTTKTCLPTISPGDLCCDDVPLHDIELVVIVAEASGTGADKDVQRDVSPADDTHGLLDQPDRGSYSYRETGAW